MTGAAHGKHYGRPDLECDILQALGHQPGSGAPEPKALAALDQFHVGGADATRRLAALAQPRPGLHVLDLGSGLGGPARLLAGEFGARVTGIDLSPEFCRVAARLNVLTGFDDKISIVCGDAVGLPFAGGSFDIVWTEHVAMNIADRAALYGECARVLRPGGRLAVYDIVRGELPQELQYPVPWARGASASHLLKPERLRDVLAAAGLAEYAWTDETATARDWLTAVTRRPPMASSSRTPESVAAPPRATLQLVMGPDFPRMTANLRDNFTAGRVAAVQAVFEKGAA